VSVRLPKGWHITLLDESHDRRAFDCGVARVNEWLRGSARQSQARHLSATKVLLDDQGVVAGFYTLAYSHVRLNELPHDVARKLPDRLLPVAVLAWLGVDRRHRGRQLGDRLLAQALLDCHEAGTRIPFVAVVIDCLDATAKAFFQRYDFREFPGQPMRLLLPKALLDVLCSARRNP